MAIRDLGHGVVIVSTYPPRRCGLASYTADLVTATREVAPDLRVGVAAVDRDGMRYGPDVVAVIDQDRVDSYRAAAARIADLGTTVVLIEHEYGIFGGADGSYLLALVAELTERAVPYVVTTHTVLARPSHGQRETLRQLCAGAAAVTVFTAATRDLLAGTWVADPARVVVVPHGAPDELQYGTDPRTLRSEIAELTPNSPVVTTFGLLSAGKGVADAVDAVAQLVAMYPGLRYVVAGQTHPEVARTEGEACRSELLARVRRLRLTRHVRFIDAFLTVPELGALLRRSTVCVTPYRSPEQISSGALTFALAAGRPVVSTAYRYAEDMLSEGAGVLVPCGDPDALAAGLDKLLADPQALAGAARAAAEAGAELSWPEVAARTADLLRVVAGRPVPAATASRVSRLRLSHLRRLAAPAGIVQFARGADPDFMSGSCVDDMARLGIVAADLAALGVRTRQATAWMRSVLLYLSSAVTPTGMHNVRDVSGGWTDRPHLGDHVGRAMWAAGRIAGTAHAPFGIRKAAGDLLDRLSTLAVPLTGAGLRPTAYAILGLADGAPVRHRGLVALLLEVLDSHWERAATPDWPWPEDRLTYDNGRLVEAMLVGAGVAGFPEAATRALDGLEWLVGQVGLDDGPLRCVGNRWRHREAAGFGTGSGPDDGDEQPIDAAALVASLVAAYGHTGEIRYAIRAVNAFRWFLGRNRLGVDLYDAATGGCRDGLGVDAASVNEGAESTLAYHQAVLSLAQAGLWAVVDREPGR